MREWWRLGFGGRPRESDEGRGGMANLSLLVEAIEFILSK